ncbi:MAG: dihydroneopterin aldolase [Chitinophagales bacterium]|nr:dihydroneopterin aldolase [Chitinophagales bacterium]
MTTTNKVLIEVRGVRVKANHGWYEEERVNGNDFEVDICLTLKNNHGKNTADELNNTLNYEQVYAIILEEMAITSKLLEEVLTRMEARIRSFESVEAGEIRLCKLNPALLAQAEKVCVRYVWGEQRNCF